MKVWRDGEANQAWLERARRKKGEVVIVGTISSAEQNKRFFTIVSRDDLMGTLSRVSQISRRERKKMASAVAREVHRLIGALSEAAHPEFPEHIALLKVFHFLDGPSTLTGSGLSQLRLEIDEDESLPWYHRGQLDPVALRSLRVPRRRQLN